MKAAVDRPWPLRGSSQVVTDGGSNFPSRSDAMLIAGAFMPRLYFWKVKLRFEPPETGAVMQELDVTWKHALSVWWLLM